MLEALARYTLLFGYIIGSRLLDREKKKEKRIASLLVVNRNERFNYVKT